MISSETRLRELMTLSLEGDESAYRDLLMAVAARLQVYFARRLFGDMASAQDLTQETLMAIHNKRATYDPGRPFTPWLYAIARYKLADHWRHAPPSAEPSDTALANLVSPLPGADAQADHDDLERLLGLLPIQQAESIRLTKILGLTVEEAGAHLGLSAANVKVSVHRGLKSLRARIGRL